MGLLPDPPPPIVFGLFSDSRSPDQWQNCSLIFGIEDHLVQHLLKDHTNPNLQMVRCHWRGCGAFFATQQSVKEVGDTAAITSWNTPHFDCTWTETSSSAMLVLLLQELPEHIRSHVVEDTDCRPDATYQISSP